VDILFFIGIALLFGFAGGKLSNRFKLPAVVGYLITGVILGPSFLKLFSLELLDNLGVVSDIALGVVAFLIGSELRMSTLRRLGTGRKKRGYILQVCLPVSCLWWCHRY